MQKVGRIHWVHHSRAQTTLGIGAKTIHRFSLGITCACGFCRLKNSQGLSRTLKAQSNNTGAVGSDYYHRMGIKTRILAGFGTAAVLVGLLTGCGPVPGDSRPGNSNLIAGINLLVSSFDANHPNLFTWKTNDIKNQLLQKIPVGIDTEAGWLLQWPHATATELSQVVVPWTLLGQYPSHPTTYFNHYSGGNLVPQATSIDIVANIVKTQMQGDPYFGAVVNIRSSIKDSHWIIFTTVPYLPVTDIAYGFATVINKKWGVVDFGTALVGCGKVPHLVESEFGYQCPTS